MYQAKKIGTTEKNTKYTIFQDNNRFHTTLQYGQLILYDCFENVSSEDELNDNITRLEAELLSKLLPPPLDL